MAKVGRPKEVNPRDKIIGVRLTEKEYNELLAYNETHNQTITQTVVEGLNSLYEKKPFNGQ